jgi:hypothetical protein
MRASHWRNRRRRAQRCAPVVLLAVVAAALCGCRTETARTSDPGEARLLRASPGKPMLRTELSFGLNRRDGGAVTEDEWRAFLRDEVSPRFPDGLTVLDSRGQWRGPDHKLVEEPSRVVILLYEPSDPTASRRIEQIRSIYKSRFNQDSVMRADSVERLSF